MSKITKITQNIIFSQFEAALCQDWIRQQIAPSSRVALTSGASDKASRFSRSHQLCPPALLTLGKVRSKTEGRDLLPQRASPSAVTIRQRSSCFRLAQQLPGGFLLLDQRRRRNAG